jgi:hypothetical protein
MGKDVPNTRGHACRISRAHRNSAVLASLPPGAGAASAGHQPEAVFEALFACPALTHDLAVALQNSGVTAVVVSSAVGGAGDAVIQIPASDKNTAIDILLHKLRAAQAPSPVSAEPAVVLMA